jgi:hypothetical protein
MLGFVPQPNLHLLDISRKQCINLDYFVGAKRLGRQFDGKIRYLHIPSRFALAQSGSHNLFFGDVYSRITNQRSHNHHQNKDKIRVYSGSLY